jgi:DNA-binding MarR family transcriptional regulator
VVDRLGARGFVTALADPTDRRRRAVALTERGREVTTAATAIAAEITAETLAPLTADERETVATLLKKLS